MSNVIADRDTVTFETDNGETYRLWHSQDCCESVAVEDICGSLSDLVGSPILQAEESTSKDDPADYPKRDWVPESMTWTFYRLATIKGSVVIRFLGESNGYYSESVSFDKLSA